MPSSNFKILHDKFINDKTRKNYYSLVCFLKKKYKIMTKNIEKLGYVKNLNINLTDNTGCLIFSSNYPKDNTWSKYKKGSIKFKKTKEITVINKAEKNKNSVNIYNKCDKNPEVYFARKVGSGLQVRYRLIEIFGIDDSFDGDGDLTEVIEELSIKYGLRAFLIVGVIIIVLGILYEEGDL